MRVVVKMELEKETKGTYRYKELERDGGNLAIGTLYVKKGIVEGTAPTALTVTIEG